MWPLLMCTGDSFNLINLCSVVTRTLSITKPWYAFKVIHGSIQNNSAFHCFLKSLVIITVCEVLTMYLFISELLSPRWAQSFSTACPSISKSIGLSGWSKVEHEGLIPNLSSRVYLSIRRNKRINLIEYKRVGTSSKTTNICLEIL